MNPFKTLISRRLVHLNKISKTNKSLNVIVFCERKYSSGLSSNLIKSKWTTPAPNMRFYDYMFQNLDIYPDKTAIQCGITGRGFTYSQLYKLSTTFAASLRSKLGLRDGDCVAVMLPNMPEYPVIVLGGIKAGCLVTTVNPTYKEVELNHQLSLTDAKVVITIPECYNSVSQSLRHLKKDIPIVVTLKNPADSLPEGTINFMELSEDFGVNTDCLKDVQRSVNDTAIIPFSSGTTGLPKGVEIIENNLIAGCTALSLDDTALVEPTTASNQSVVPIILPFFHIFGLSVAMLANLSMGAKLVTLPRFAPDTFLDTIQKHRAHVLYIVPPIGLFLSAHPMVKSEHLDSVRHILCGAAPLAAADALKVVNRFQKKDLVFLQGYGLTETTGFVSCIEKGSTNYGSIGIPLPNIECKIVPEDGDEPLGPNQVGELLVRGENVMKGYYKDVKSTSKVFTADRWFRTGDMVYYDDDKYIYVTDRLKDLIKVKGFQVAPAELEGILRRHPKIADAAILGVPHPIKGEAPKAFVVAKKGETLNEDDVKEFVAEKVATYKKIEEVKFINEIPKNLSGKILKNELRNL